MRSAPLLALLIATVATVAPTAVEGPPGDAIVPISEAFVVPPPNDALPVSTMPVAPHISPVDALPTPSVPVVDPMTSVPAAEVSAAPLLVSSVTSIVLDATTVVDDVTSLAAEATRPLASHLSGVQSSATSIVKGLTTAHWGSNTTLTTTTSSPPYTPSAVPTETQFPGGLQDPTLDKPCYDSSCANPDSHMNFVVTLSMDPPKETGVAGAAVTVPPRSGIGFAALVVAIGGAMVLL